jgi:hypothetical protein
MQPLPCLQQAVFVRRSSTRTAGYDADCGFASAAAVMRPKDLDACRLLQRCLKHRRA